MIPVKERQTHICDKNWQAGVAQSVAPTNPPIDIAGVSPPPPALERLIHAFSDITLDNVKRPAHESQAVASNVPISPPSPSPSIPRTHAQKMGRSKRYLTERAMNVLRFIHNETFELAEKLQTTIEDGLSFEFLVRMESRLETLRIAADKTKRREPDIISLKEEVLENLSGLEERCANLRASLPFLKDSGPVEFSSG